MFKVDFYSAEIKYTGSFDSYTQDDWKKKAIAKCNSGYDAYDYTVKVPTWEEARALEDQNDYIVTDHYPCNKIVYVKWAGIRDEENDYDEEEE